MQNKTRHHLGNYKLLLHTVYLLFRPHWLSYICISTVRTIINYNLSYVNIYDVHAAMHTISKPDIWQVSIMLIRLPFPVSSLRITCVCKLLSHQPQRQCNDDPDRLGENGFCLFIYHKI